MVPTPDPSLWLMFVTQYDDGVWLVPTDPPVAFSYADGTTISPPDWSNLLEQADGIFIAWSNDARRIAFSANPPTDETPYSLSIAEPTTGTVTAANPQGFRFSPLGGGPTWSPDGSLLALPLESPETAFKPAIHIITPEGGTPRRITPAGGLFPSWSPVDEHKIAYLDYTPGTPYCGPLFPDDLTGCDLADLKLVDLPTGTEFILLEGVHLSIDAGGLGNWYHAPAWSPDGQWIAVFHGGDEPDLVVLTADRGVSSILTRSVDRGSYISIAPDGKALAFASRASGNDEIIVIPLGPGPIQGLPQPAAAERNVTQHPSSDISPVWSPDGRFLAFLSDRGTPSRAGFYQPYTLDLITGEVRRLTDDLVFTRPVWAPATYP